MGELKINREKIDNAVAEQLVRLCPFAAIEYENGELSINGTCKMCKLCVKKGPAGAIEYIESVATNELDKSAYKGVAVFADCTGGKLHPVTLELLGKARELAKVINHPVYAVMIGFDVSDKAEELLSYGADRVFVYDNKIFKDFSITTYTSAFEDFVNKVSPSSVLVGATNAGRSLAPRVAARFRTGLTADCTVLEMKENTDLVQIRPAFGGNIMAQIITPKNRPQFCTVRYKVFSAPERLDVPSGKIVNIAVNKDWLDERVVVTETYDRPPENDISDAEVIIAVGRGLKSKDDIPLIEELADLIGAQVACTRPLVENGTFDASHQIGLSGKTVKPKLIITFGISGAVQFAAGMKGSDCIIAVNSDKNASIFDIAHYCVVGDMYEIIPELIKKIKEEK